MARRLRIAGFGGLLALALLGLSAGVAFALVSTDVKPPLTKLTYPNRQDFIGKKTVFVHLRSNEAASAFASGQLEIPSEHAIWGLYKSESAVGAGEKVTLRLRLPRATLEAAERALSKGRNAVIKVTVSATDAAGNESGKTVATIKQKR